MSPSARFAHTDYPADVEDLLSTPSTVATVAGYAVVATHTSPHALLFAIAGGSSLDAVPIPLQTLSSRPALSVWLGSKSGSAVNDIGVAVLSADGVLRVYRQVSVLQQTVPRCEEIRVGGALESSAGDVCEALEVIYDGQGLLYVFGGRGSVAIVSLNEARLRVEPVVKERERSSSRFGTMFYSAIRSIGAGIGGDEDWVRGAGMYKIVGFGVVADGVVLVRQGGCVEKWCVDGMKWQFESLGLLDIAEGGCVESAGVTTDGTVVLLTISEESVRSIACFDVRSSAPERAELLLPLTEQGSECFLAVSGDISYLYMPDTRTLAWLSVARGVPSDGQVQGSTTLETDMQVLTVVDASYGLPEAAVAGGVAACLHTTGVWLASSAVPAPMSLDADRFPSGPNSIEECVPLLWRAFLQYAADQGGAAKASLRGLVGALVAEGFDVEEALRELLRKVSRKIVVSEHDPESDPMTLLIDMELEKKQDQHRIFLSMITDGEVFAEVRPRAPSISEDRIWDAVDVDTRYAVVTDHEMLAAARRIRELENVQSEGGQFQRFNDAASASVANHDQVRGIRPPPSASHADDSGLDDGPTVLSRALLYVGKGLSDKPRGEREQAVGLYQYPQQMLRFLPALEKCMTEALDRLRLDQSMADGNEATEGPSYRKAARNVVSLTCEAAIDVVKGSLQAREDNMEMLSQGPNGMNGVGNWLSELTSCRRMLLKIAERSLGVAERSVEAEQKGMKRAATLVVDELLACASIEAASRGLFPREKMQASMNKRRRLDYNYESSAWARELRAALEMLRKSGLNEDAFRLAEKYGDYGVMLSLRVGSPEFDVFMENELARFGEGFAFYAFRWLEDRGKIHLLLRGRTIANNVGSRSEKLTGLLSEYFKGDRKHMSNLAWMHWISVGDTGVGVDGLITQIESISKPGKEGSTANARMLSSVAKLSLLANRDEDEGRSERRIAQLNYVSARLHLTRVQETVEPMRDALAPGSTIIRKLLDEGSEKSEKLGANIVEAIYAVQACGSLGDEAANMEDVVWRRCVERQHDLWMRLVKEHASSSDTQLRKELQATALYVAARDVGLSEREIADVVDRGAFECSEFAREGCVHEITRLVKTTVSLSAAA